MTRNLKSQIFILHELPDTATEEDRDFVSSFNWLRDAAADNRWHGLNADNFLLEYYTYDKSLSFKCSFRDKNAHTHTITVSLLKETIAIYGEPRCHFEYLFTADNFKVGVCSVRSFAEELMEKLWYFDIDSELCRCDWGLMFDSWSSSVPEIMDNFISTIFKNIKPMDWFYEK